MPLPYPFPVPQIYVFAPEVHHHPEDYRQQQPIIMGSQIASDVNSYRINQLLHRGSVDLVFLATNNADGKNVAIKCKWDTPFNRNEVKMLRRLASSEIETPNQRILKFHGSVSVGRLSCLVFERLENSLRKLIAPNYSYSLHFIRTIVKQLLETLVFLKRHRIVHNKITLDNVMLVDAEGQPGRVKLTDFSCAKFEPKFKALLGDIYPPTSYSPPEVIMGQRTSYGSDLWSVICIGLEMFIGKPFFHPIDNNARMAMIVEIIGLPPRSMNFMNSNQFFELDDNTWQLKCHVLVTWEEWKKRNPEHRITLEKLKDFNKLADEYPMGESVDRLAFVDFTRTCLTWNLLNRIDPTRAVNHDFITMSRFLVGDLEYYNNGQLTMHGAYHQMPQEPKTAKQTKRQKKKLFARRQAAAINREQAELPREVREPTDNELGFEHILPKIVVTPPTDDGADRLEAPKMDKAVQTDRVSDSDSDTGIEMGGPYYFPYCQNPIPQPQPVPMNTIPFYLPGEYHQLPIQLGPHGFPTTPFFGTPAIFVHGQMYPTGPRQLYMPPPNHPPAIYTFNYVQPQQYPAKMIATAEWVNEQDFTVRDRFDHQI